MDDAVIGKEVDGYHIESILGRGGMGVVYRAEDVALSRPVALKRINPAQAHREQFLRRFRAEAKALARINSPFITSIYALRDTDIGLLIVMEYVDGGTLKDRIVEGPMRPAVVVPIVRQILRAFGDAHGAGVIHRDIKPQNIMMTSDGAVKITDFGIAKLRRQDSGETVTQGGQGGTLKYMSPEQIEKIDQVDNRSDLYALGMTMYEMLAGRLPFDELDTDFDIMRKVVEGDVPPPGEYVPNLPGELAQVIEGATATRPEDRYPSADAMLDALDAAAERIEDTDPQPMWDVEEDDTAADTATDDAASDTAVGTADGTILDDSLLEEIEDREDRQPSRRDAPPADDVTTDRAVVRGESSEDASGVSPRVVAGIVAVLLVMAAGGYIVLGPSGATTPTLTLQTEPGAAVVEIDADSIGTTPLATYALEPGNHALTIRKSGYKHLDTTITVSEGQSLVLSGVELRPETVRLRVTSDPAGARVLVRGGEVGTTPARELVVDPGEATVRLEKDGFAPFDTTITFKPGSQVTLAGLRLGSGETVDQTPTRERERPAGTSATEAAPTPTGQLSVTAPAASIVQVGGEEQSGGGSFRVATGPQTVRCLHPKYQTIETRVNVSQNDTASVSCVYQHVVFVNTTTSWGNIWVDGANTETQTPGEVTLPPGRYRIEVRRVGVDDFQVEGGAYRLAPENGGKERQRERFETGYFDVTVKPAFQKLKHNITFRPKR